MYNISFVLQLHVTRGRCTSVHTTDNFLFQVSGSARATSMVSTFHPSLALVRRGNIVSISMLTRQVKRPPRSIKILTVLEQSHHMHGTLATRGRTVSTTTSTSTTLPLALQPQGELTRGGSRQIEANHSPPCTSIPSKKCCFPQLEIKSNVGASRRIVNHRYK
jgi:hypothetical protein